MSLRYAVLTLLDIEPGSGYDLKRRFERSVSHFWSASHQQMYRELHRLHDEGLLDCTEQPQAGKPDKKIYSLTDRGREALRAWVQQPPPAQKIREPFLIQLFAGHHLSREQAQDAVQRQLDQHRALLDSYLEQNEKVLHSDPKLQEQYWLAHQTLLLGIEAERTWIEWGRRCCGNWESRINSSDPLRDLPNATSESGRYRRLPSNTLPLSTTSGKSAAMIYTVTPIRENFLRKARETGLDDLEQPVRQIVAEGGEPCRDALRRARPGRKSCWPATVPSRARALSGIRTCVRAGASRGKARSPD
ncbi:PadR family transcriptional regulator [Microbulbifer taiwanensis]|uniref:PadR family transcriptional regulator n=1 Tax=Microbulbifer taiwanensis TaxID=986746 RepID=UPI0036214B46